MNWQWKPKQRVTYHVHRAHYRARTRYGEMIRVIQIIGIIGAIFVALGVILSLVACGPTTSSGPMGEQPVASAPASSPAQPTYTVPQQQAIASAQSYLSSDQGFSKLGLTQQLSSSYGEGFSRSLAKFAVNHVQVSWRHQAVLSARGYMNSQPGWSYSGLVKQLSSPYGEKFTLAQAEYAARAVGL